MRLFQHYSSIFSSWLLLLIVLPILSGCGSGTTTTGGTTGGGTTGTGIVASVTLASGGPSITADGASSIFLRATVIDTAGVAMSGKSVNFATTAGTLSATSATTDSSGIAQVSLTAPIITGTATMTANYGGAASTPVTVNFLPGAVAAIGTNLAPSSVLPSGTTTLSIAVVDANGNSVAAGQPINFTTTAAGTFNTTSVPTDSNGRASVSYIASNTAGTETLTAKASNGISGTATLTVASNIAVVGSISVTPTMSVIAAGGGTSTINAKVLDTALQPIQGATVAFSTTSGTLSAASATTNASGIASVVLTSSANVQAAKVTGSASGFAGTATVNFSAGAPSVISLNAAPNSANPGGQSTITAAVVDAAGNPVIGEPLTFSFVQRGSGTPALSATSAITDANGLASVGYTAGANAGTDIINAITSNSVTAAGASRASITVASGANVVGSIVATTSRPSIPVTTGTTLISAIVKDATGAVLPSQTVTFTASSGTFTGSVTTITATTGTDGIATTTLTASGSLLTSMVSATVGGYTSNVSVVFTAGAANTVTVTALPSAINTGGSSTLTALVVDSAGNPVLGETVTFAFTAKGSGMPSLGSTTATTNNSGLAVVAYTAGTTAGTDTISATTSNAKVGSVSITSSAAAMLVSSITLTTGGASVPAGGVITAVRAKVTDTTGAVAAGVTVNFTTSAGILSAASAVTDNTGVAQVNLTSPLNTGSATISASANGVIAPTVTVNFVAGSIAAIGTNAQPSSVLPGGTTTLTIAAVDANLNPVANQIINFSTSNAAGIFSSLSATTDTNGRASVNYIASNTVGTEVLTAKATNGISGTANLTVASNIAVVGSISVAPTTASIKAGGATTFINVTVRDTSGQPISGALVNFSVSAGTLSAASATTNASGIASVTLTSAASVLTATVTATSSGYTNTTSVAYTAGVPTVISLNAAPSAANPGGQSVITAAVVDTNGNPVAGEPLTFRFDTKASGTPALSATSATTDANGLATVTYIAGVNAGTDIVNAITSNSVTAAGGSRASIVVASGANVVGSIVATTSKLGIPVTTGTTQISAIVKDATGTALAGQTVTFATSSGSLSATSVVTGTDGIATTTLTASGSVLTSTVSATVGGFTSNVKVDFTAGAANTVTVTAAPSAINTGGSSTITALVLDTSGNPVIGETVTFAFTAKASGTPTLGSTTALTNANGLAVVAYAAGASAGMDTISATTSNAKVGSVSITSSATATVVNALTLTTGASTIAAGGGTTGTTVVRATVTDITGAAAAGVTVNFTTSAGALTAASAVTDSTGIAQTTLTSSNNLGTATITANASGFVKTATVTFTYGSPSTVKLLTSSGTLTSGQMATLTAIVADAKGNPVANETVTFNFTANPTGGTLAAATATTSVDGIASVVYTAGAIPGSDTVTAKTTNNTTSTAVTLIVSAGASASTLAISTTLTSVKSDNSNNATITVTATNVNNVVVPGVTINFVSTGNSGLTGGTLSIPSAVTNVSGQASVLVSSGSADQSNRTVNVTATAGAISTTIPIQISGSSVTLTSGSTVLVSSPSSTSTTLTIKASNAGAVGVYNAPVTLGVTGTGTVTLTPTGSLCPAPNAALYCTDVNGQLAVTVTGGGSGTATVTATALGASKTLDFTVSASGGEFKITAPTANPAALTMGTPPLAPPLVSPLPFTVQVGSNAAITQIRLSTSIGIWSTCGGVGATGVNTSVCTLPSTAFSGVYPSQAATASLSSATVAGAANVQVEGLDVNNKVLVSDSRSVAITSAAAAAAAISLHANVNVLQPSSGTTTNTATITATVRDSYNQPVGNSAVVFSLVNPPGGGETVSPALVLSSDGVASADPLGQARTTFTSGSLATGSNGVIIRGRVVSSGDACPADGGTAICADTQMNIGGTAGSIVIGEPTKITELNLSTYQAGMSLLVADGNGNPMSNAVVSLSAWPVAFYTGTYVGTVGSCKVEGWSKFGNEDLNQNLILNTLPTNEDLSTHTAQTTGPNNLFLGFNAGNTSGALNTDGYIIDGILTPQNTAAGNVPATVTTDSNGLATFNLTWLKQYSNWIDTKITARITVLGTESTSSLTMTLPALLTDVQACVLPPSPYNP